MSASSIEAGKAFLKLLVENTEFRKGLDEGVKQLEDFGKRATKIGVIVGGVGAAITAPFAASAKVFADTGSSLNEMSERTGVAVDQLSALNFAAKQSGTDIDTVEAALRKMAKTISAAGQGSDEATAALTRVGLSVRQLIGLTPGEQFTTIAKSISEVKDPTQRAADAMAIFGKTGTLLLPMISDLDGLTEKAQSLGVVMGGEAAKNAETLTKSMEALKSQFAAVADAVGAQVAPYITKFNGVISGGTAVVIEFIKRNRVLVLSIAAIGVTAAGVVVPIIAIGGALTKLTAGIKALNSALIILESNPYLIALTVGLVLLTAAAGPLIERLLSVGTAEESAAAAASKHAAAQASVSDAVAKGNKVLDDRAIALERLSSFEKGLVSQFDARAKAEAVNGKEAELRRQTELQEIENEIAEEKRRLAINKELDAGFPNRQTRLGGTAPIPSVDVASNEAKIRDLERRRAEINGDAAKQAEAQAKIDAEGKARADKLEADRQKAEADRQQQAEAQARSILSQFDSFSRPERGGFGGQFAQQIGGTSRQDATEQRMLKFQQDQNTLLTQIKDALLNGKPLLIGGI